MELKTKLYFPTINANNNNAYLIRDNSVFELVQAFKQNKLFQFSREKHIVIIVEHFTFWYRFSNLSIVYRFAFQFQKCFAKWHMTIDYWLLMFMFIFHICIVQPHKFIILEWRIANENECKIVEKKKNGKICLEILLFKCTNDSVVFRYSFPSATQHYPNF